MPPTNYPGSIDSFTDPASSNPMNAPSHSGQHTNINDAMVAVQTAIGTTAAPKLAPLISPVFTGTPAAPTATLGTNTTQLANTSFVTAAVATETSRAQTAEALLAPKSSPALTGTPTAPTATLGTNTTAIATTAFVIANAGVGNVTSVFTRSGAVVALKGDYTAIQVPNVVVAVTQAAAPAINTDNGTVFEVLNLAQAVTSLTTNLTGTPVDGQQVCIAFSDNGTARAITPAAKFLQFPTLTTTPGQYLYTYWIYNSAASAFIFDHYNTVSVGGGASLLTQVNATTSGAIAAAVGDVVNTTAAATVTLPAAPTIGQAVLVNRGNHTALITITANAGQNINGGATAGSVTMTAGNATANAGQALFLYTGGNIWRTVSSGSDLGQAQNFGGPVHFQATATMESTLQVTGAIEFTSGGSYTISPNQISATYATNGGDFWLQATSGTFTVTLTNEQVGQLLFITNTGAGTITLANVHNGPTVLPPGAGGIYIQDGTNFDCIGSFGTSTNTAGVATVTTPTLGAAAQLAQTTADAMLYIAVGAAGTLTVAIGPTSGVTTVIVNGLAAAVGDLYTVRLPAGWFVKVTTGTTATWTTTAVTC
jgi:hypothetical protein